MSAIAADTWGIPGPTFALLYPVLIVVAAVVAAIGRRTVGAGPDVAGPTPTSTELAYLRGGDALAVAASLGALRAAGSLDVLARPLGRPLTKDPLQLAVLAALDAATTSRQRTVAALVRHGYVRPALDGLRTDLAARGLTRTPAQTTRLRSWSLLVWAVVVLGLVRAAAGHANGHPIGFVVFETVVAVVVAGRATVVKGGPATARGRDATKAARRSNAHLDPKLQPSWRTYGPVGAGLSVALFGPAAILLAEPAFAHTVEAKQAAVGAGGSVGDSGGSGCSSGSSCGGGGSSCGGGGGCGGGGCGG